MAEQRCRHRQVEVVKNDNRLSVVPEEDEGSTKKMKPFVSKSKDATVEVIVKVKKRREKPGSSDGKSLIPENGFRKGSWGDLLLKNSKAAAARKEVNDKVEKDSKKSSPPKSKKKVSNTNDCCQIGGKSCLKENSPLCQKIPITDKLYLETHTHVKKIRPLVVDDDDEEVPVSCSKRSSLTSASARHAALLRENEELWEEVDRLRREMEFSRSRRLEPINFEQQRPAKVVPAPVVIKERSSTSKSRAQARGTQTSQECIAAQNAAAVASSSTRKITEVCQTDGNQRSPPKKSQPPSKTALSTAVGTTDISQLENLRLEKENEALRLEAMDLLTQVNKARADYLECYNTMKELYQIAANLKQENNNLAQTQQQQQTLHAKLLQALAENREIKGILDTLMNKPKSSPGIGEDQLLHVRNVIQDVKKTIAREMEVLELEPKTRSGTTLRAEKDGNLNGAFRQEESFLNDTNASEIQHIFSAHPPEMRRGLNLEDRSSSTQYMTLGGISTTESHYRPSPCANEKFSPRISTPNSSDVSVTLSEAEVAAGVNSFRPISKAPVTGNPESEASAVSNDDTDNEWKRLEMELAKSFSSVRNQLSTTSYSSSSSTTSPNPIRRK